MRASDRTGHWQRRDENANKRQNSTKQKPISLGICILHARSPNKHTYLLSFSPFPNVKGFQCKASRFQPIRHKPAADALMPAFGSISSLPQVELLLPKSIPSGIALLVEVVQSLHYFLPRHSTGKGGFHYYGWGLLQPPSHKERISEPLHQKWPSAAGIYLGSQKQNDRNATAVASTSVAPTAVPSYISSLPLLLRRTTRVDILETATTTACLHSSSRHCYSTLGW